MLSKFILKFKLSIYLIEFSKKVSPPGFDGLSLYDVGTFFFHGIQKGYLNNRASALAFKFFLAIFPSILFLFTLIAYIPIPNFQEQLISMLTSILPHNAYDFLISTIEDIVKNKRGGLLSISFLIALYFATNGALGMIKAFNHTYHTIETRSPMVQRMAAIAITFIASFLVVLSIAIIIFNEYAISKLTEWGIIEKYVAQFIIVSRWLVLIALMFFTFSFLYYLVPAKKMKWRFISPGSTLASLASLITSVVFSAFVNNFGQYNKVYGSIGTIIVLMLWIYFNSLILLLGFELNASIKMAKGKVILPKRPRKNVKKTVS
jgi:membrane protein